MGRGMRWGLGLLFVVLGLWLGGGGVPAIAATDFTQQPAIAVKVHLGNAANELKFFPENLQFVAGNRYKLVLDNPSGTKHYFTAKDFADGIWSQKIEAGNVEIKGAIHEVELKPGAIAEWVFIPLKTGTYELHCTIPGHAAAGMVGQVTIQSPT